MALNAEARFRDLYRRYNKQIHAYCARRAGESEVPDLVADVFLVAWKKLDQVPSNSEAVFWLYAVAFRMVSRRWRTLHRHNRVVERLQGLTDVPIEYPADVVVVQRHEYELVREAASRLRALDQEILRLTLWEELTHKQVAKVLDIDVGAVKQRAHRARQRLGVEFRRLSGESNNPPLLGRKVPQ